MYDKQGYIDFMKSEKKSKQTIGRYSGYINTWMDFLKQKGIDIDDAEIRHLDEFIKSESDTLSPFSHYAASIRIYYRFTRNQDMEWAFEKLDYYQPFYLKDLIGIDKKYIPALKNNGILTNRDLLDVCIKEKNLDQLASEYGIPAAQFIELVKLSDLARVFGKIRIRLYYDAGFDTFEKIAKWDYQAFREKIKSYIKENNLEYNHPTPNEASWAVRCAQLRPKLINY